MDRITLRYLMDYPLRDIGLYQKLMDCLIPDYGQEKVDIRPWFEGIIKSLYWKVNKNVLILEGPQAIGKSHFFHHLFPIPLNSEGLIKELEFNKHNLTDPLKDNFKIVDDSSQPYSVRVEKRLESYYLTTTKWDFAERKMFFVVKVRAIDWDLYNIIDKQNLWIEIFNRYKLG